MCLLLLVHVFVIIVFIINVFVICVFVAIAIYWLKWRSCVYSKSYRFHVRIRTSIVACHLQSFAIGSGL